MNSDDRFSLYKCRVECSYLSGCVGARKEGRRMGHSLSSIYGDAHTFLPSFHTTEPSLFPHSPSALTELYPQNAYLTLTTYISVVLPFPLCLYQVAWITSGPGAKSRNLPIPSMCFCSVLLQNAKQPVKLQVTRTFLFSPCTNASCVLEFELRGPSFCFLSRL